MITLTWTDSAGVATVLSGDYGYDVKAGVSGVSEPPPVVNVIAEYVSFDGAALVNRRRAARPLVLPVKVTHTSRPQTAVATLLRLFQGPGALTFDDGTTARYLRQVVYETAVEIEAEQSSGQGWRLYAVSLVALDPWWYGAPELYALPVSAATPFNAAIPFNAAVPFNGGSSITIDVDGDTDAFPVVTVYGPATGVSMTAGGLEWETAVELAASDVLVVDTRPGSRGPRLNGGAVDWSLLTAESRLWLLPTGSQSVLFGVAGDGDLTAAQLQFSPRYLTP